jgi:multiple sugar transport system substrate-binding protein
MKKMLFVLGVVLLLIGCGESNSAETVSFMVFGDPAERRAYESLVDAFETKHPEVDVAITHIPSPREYRTRLATEFAAGSPPDISLMNFRRYAAFAAADLLEPLDPYLKASELIQPDDFYPIATQAFTWRDEIMCIPQNISSLVVYYNQDLFDAAGVPYPADDWTWDDFLATAQALTADADADELVSQYGLGVDPSLFRLAPFVWQNGGRVVDDVDFPTQLGLTRYPSQVAMQWFVDLQMVHGVVPDRIAEASLDSESRFVAGTTAMFLNSRRGTPTYREIDRFTWDVAPLPQGTEKAGVLHSDAYCLAAATENKDAAWTFIEFANSAEGQAIIAESGRTVPSLIAVAESAAFLNPDQLPARANVWLDTVDTLRLVPVISTWEEIEGVASEEIERAFYGDITVSEAALLAKTRTEEYFILGVTARE